MWDRIMAARPLFLDVTLLAYTAWLSSGSPLACTPDARLLNNSC